MAASTKPICCPGCYRDIPNAFIAFNTRQQKYVADNLSSTRSDAFANGAFSHLDSHNMALSGLLNTLIASPLIPEATKIRIFRPWRDILIELAAADLPTTPFEVYYRIQAMLDLLCFSTVQVSDDRGLFGPDLSRLQALIDEPDAHEGFTQEHFTRYLKIMNGPWQTLTSVDEAVAAKEIEAQGTLEGSPERQTLAYLKVMQANPEWAKGVLTATKVPLPE